jgi:putative phosphoesterase
MVKIGVISDTHGYFHPRLPVVFQDVSLILHAGDIGRLEVIRRLEEIAPVKGVRGNVDGSLRTPRFPWRQVIQVEQVAILLAHQRVWSREMAAWLCEEYGLEQPNVFVYGHTHQAEQGWEEGMLFFNPGVAGKSRVGSGPSVGTLSLHGGKVVGQIVSLRLP